MTLATGSTEHSRFDMSTFRQVLGHYPTGVAIISASTEIGPVGLTVGSFTSVSLDPPLIAFFPDRLSTTWPKIEATGKFCVNVLAMDQQHLCRTFASKGADKYGGVTFGRSPQGAPVIEGAIAWIDCDIHSVQEIGDHLIVVGHVHSLDVMRNEFPPLFFRGGYGAFADQTS